MPESTSQAPPSSGASGAGVVRATLLAATPLGAAIAVFGVVFGAAGAATFGPVLTIGMSLVVFSGAVQFAVLALVAGGAGAVAVVITALALNARNLVLGAVLRHRLHGSRVRRAALSWFLVDESFGLAVAAPHHAAIVLPVAGVVCYLAWQAGTILGVAGARLAALEGVASAIFPVLFIGLAAITVRGRQGVLRAVVAGLLVAALAVALPAAHAFLPIIAAGLVALPGVRR